MKARINGVEFEGTPDEIVTVLDKMGLAKGSATIAIEKHVPSARPVPLPSTWVGGQGITWKPSETLVFSSESSPAPSLYFSTFNTYGTAKTILV